MEMFVDILHIIVTTFMILVVLIQGGNQGGVGAAFGGGNSQGVFGASGATSLLGKLTYVAGLGMLVTSLSLVIIQGKGGDVGLSDKLKAEKEAQQVQQNDDASDASNDDTSSSADDDAQDDETEGSN